MVSLLFSFSQLEYQMNRKWVNHSSQCNLGGKELRYQPYRSSLEDIELCCYLSRNMILDKLSYYLSYQHSCKELSFHSNQDKFIEIYMVLKHYYHQHK